MPEQTKLTPEREAEIRSRRVFRTLINNKRPVGEAEPFLREYEFEIDRLRALLLALTQEGARSPECPHAPPPPKT